MGREYMGKRTCPKGFRKSKGLCIKKMGQWTRTYEQEEGAVKKWFEREKDGVIASVVEGYFPSEQNIRISGMDFESIEIRGHKSIIEKKSDDDLIEMVERAIRRQKKR